MYLAHSMRTGWYDDGSSWYWFGPDGSMATGWRSVVGSWYYLNGSGAMVTGWLNEDGFWYFFDGSRVMKSNCWMGDYYFLSNGVMATNAVIDGYRIGPDGKWIS